MPARGARGSAEITAFHAKEVLRKYRKTIPHLMPREAHRPSFVQRVLRLTLRQVRRTFVVAVGLTLGWTLRRATAPSSPAAGWPHADSTAAPAATAREALRTGRFRSPADMEREIITDIDAGRVTDYARLAHELLASPNWRLHGPALLLTVVRGGEEDPEAALEFCRRYTGTSVQSFKLGDGVRRLNLFSAECVSRRVIFDHLASAAHYVMANLMARQPARADQIIASAGFRAWWGSMWAIDYVPGPPRPYLPTSGEMLLSRLKLGEKVHPYSWGLPDEALQTAARMRPEDLRWRVASSLRTKLWKENLPLDQALARVAQNWPRDLLDAAMGSGFDGTVGSLTPQALALLRDADDKLTAPLAKARPDLVGMMTEDDQAKFANAFGRGEFAQIKELGWWRQLSEASDAAQQRALVQKLTGTTPQQPLASRLSTAAGQPEPVAVAEILRTPASEAEPAFEAFSQLPAQTQAVWRLDMAASFSKDAPALAASVLAAATPEEVARPEAAWMFSRVASSFVEADSVAASAWIGSLPPGPARDAGVLAMLRATASENPDTAAQWAATLQSDAARAQAAALLSATQTR